MMNDRLLYKGYYRTAPGEKTITVEGFPVGVDPETGKYVFSAVGPSAKTAFIPDNKITVSENGKAERTAETGTATAITISVILVDKIRAFSGCVDKSGHRLFHNDFVDVNGRKFFIYFSNERMRWELLEYGDAGFDLSCPPCNGYAKFKPVALYRLKDSLAAKAELIQTTEHILPKG